jgi:hypothetical protein
MAHSAKSIGDRAPVRPSQPIQIGVPDLLPD